MVAIAAAVLVAFIGGLYFITHHKKEEAEVLLKRGFSCSEAAKRTGISLSAVKRISRKMNQ